MPTTLETIDHLFESPAAESRVLLVDDHELLANALRVVVDQTEDMRVVGLAASVEEAIQRCAELLPDLVITDLRLPDGDVTDHLGRLLDVCPSARVLVVTGWPTERSFLAALDGGAHGFVSKTQPLREVLTAARRVLDGEMVLPNAYVPGLLNRVGLERRATPAVELTVREIDVLELLAAGVSTVAVANRLDISVNTVRNHLARAMAKLGAHSRLGAVAEALRLGLVAPPSPPTDISGLSTPRR